MRLTSRPHTTRNNTRHASEQKRTVLAREAVTALGRGGSPVDESDIRKEVVERHFGLDVVPVGVMRNAARRDERQIGRSAQPGLPDEPVAAVEHPAALVPVDFVFAGGILHFADVHGVVGPFDQQIDLGAFAFRERERLQSDAAREPVVEAAASIDDPIRHPRSRRTTHDEHDVPARRRPAVPKRRILCGKSRKITSSAEYTRRIANFYRIQSGI